MWNQQAVTFSLFPLRNGVYRGIYVSPSHGTAFASGKKETIRIQLKSRRFMSYSSQLPVRTLIGHLPTSICHFAQSASDIESAKIDAITVNGKCPRIFGESPQDLLGRRIAHE